VSRDFVNCFVSEHDFSSAEKAQEKKWALAPALRIAGAKARINNAPAARLKSLRENYVVPGGLWLFVPLTQHSAFGYVLGYDIPRLRRSIFGGRTPPPKSDRGSHADTEVMP
jgi:hypothetical protein